MSKHIALVTAIQQISIMLAIATFLRVEMQGKSLQTKKWYKTRLYLLAKNLGETRLLSDIMEYDLIEWREKIENQNLKIDTIHGYIRATKKFFRWLHKEGLAAMDLAAKLKLPKLPIRGKQGISDENAELILEAARKWSIRDYAMLLVFASTNARRGGVHTLKLSDLRINEPEPFCRQIQVLEKGQKERTVIMDDDTLQALRAWLEVHPGGSEYVFVKDNGKPLKVDSVSEVIDRYKKRLGIKGRCSPHQWRHRWFRKRLSKGMPLVQAAQLGGHEDVRITYKYYGRYAIKELQEAYDKYSP